jgi:hypothetical protein
MADIKNNNFKGSINNNSLGSDIKDVSVGTQSVSGIGDITGYNLPQELPLPNKILKSDGTNLIKWVDAPGIVSISYIGLVNLINTNSLVPGSIYKIQYFVATTNFYPTSYFEIYLLALSTSQVSGDGQRLMRVPKHSLYFPSLTSRGIYDPENTTYAINDIVIFGGRVYRSKTGNIGSIVYGTMLDKTNWLRIEDTDSSNYGPLNTKYYEDKIYFIEYDVDSQYVTSQADEYANIVIGEKDPEQRLNSVQNTIDLNDWNHPRILDNNTYGIWGNQTLNTFHSTSGDSDFAVIRYIWDAAGGTDLDTRTAFIDLTNSLYNLKDVGWARGGSGIHPLGGAYVGPSDTSYYMWWSGDNEGTTGGETVLIDFKKIKTDFPALQELTTRFRAFWYNNRNSGDISYEVTTYKGGTMAKDPSGFNFINTGGALVTTYTQTVNVALSGGTNQDGQDLGVIYFDFATNTSIAVLNNITGGYIKDNHLKGSIRLNDNYRLDGVGNAAYSNIEHNTNKGSIYSNTNKGAISYNDNLGDINGNICLYGEVEDWETGEIFYYAKGTLNIKYNTNQGNISLNRAVGDISYNSNNGKIESNTWNTIFGGGISQIKQNSNLGDIIGNYYGAIDEESDGGILNNNNAGSINGNESYFIILNSNKGDIVDNINLQTEPDYLPWAINIFGNSNEGNIRLNSAAAIYNNSNGGSINSNVASTSTTSWAIYEVTEADSINSLTLIADYFGYNLPQRIGTVGYILASNGTNAIWQAPPGGGGSPIEVLEEGTTIATAAVSFDFVGDAITASTINGTDITVTVNAITGSGANPQVALWDSTNTITGTDNLTWINDVNTEVGYRATDGVNTTKLGVSLVQIDTEGIAANSALTLRNWSTSNKGIISFRKSRGDIATPSPVLLGDIIGDIVYTGQTTVDPQSGSFGSTTGILRIQALSDYERDYLPFDFVHTRVALTEFSVWLGSSYAESYSSSISNNKVFWVNGDGQVNFLNYQFPIGDGQSGEVLMTDGSGQVYWGTGGGGGGGSIIVKNEGTTLTTAATALNFVGEGVNATNIGGSVTVTIPGATIIHKTYAQLQTLITSGSLIEGAWYNFEYDIDNTAGDGILIHYNIFLQAITSSRFATRGKRLMRLPKKSLYIDSSGVDGDSFFEDISYTTNQVVRFSNWIYQNITGVTGSIEYNIKLDSTNWSMIPLTDNTYYEDRVFDIEYDFTYQTVRLQFDNQGNEIYGAEQDDFVTSRILWPQNTIDFHEWNSNFIFNNKCSGVWNNLTIDGAPTYIANNIVLSTPTGLVGAGDNGTNGGFFSSY